MRVAIMLGLAVTLVGLSTVIARLWLYGVILATNPESGLEPWTAAGVVCYGFMFVFIAAIPGLPGILLARILASGPASSSSWIASLVWRFGAAVLLMAFIVAASILLYMRWHV